MSNTSSVGGESSPASARQPHESQTATEEAVNAGFKLRSPRKVQVVNAQPQKRLRARLKHFLPVFIYKFIVKLTLPSQSQQKTLALNIQEARKANSEAWDQLGKEGHHSTSQHLKELQLACEKSQYWLDLLEGRNDSPVTAQRADVINLLEQASEASDEDFQTIEHAYLAANDQLKQIQQHEIQLEADLNAAKRKLQLSESEQKVESQVLQEGRRAKEDLEALKKSVASLEEEFHQFQKNQIDEELARAAYLRYSDSGLNKTKGVSDE